MGLVVSHQNQRTLFWDRKNGENLIIFKRGALIKQSKYLKQWRSRTILLIQKYIVTFDDIEQPPTAVIPIIKLRSLVKEQSQQFFILQIITKDGQEYKFRTDSQIQRQDWFQKIKQQKIRFMKESNTNTNTSSFIEGGVNRLTFNDEQITYQIQN